MFSVIIPVHNKGSHVARSIQSVLDQTYKDFELVIINDASTDHSMDEVSKFDDPRIRIFQRDEPGPGGYAARNLGINKAIYSWIAFLDADDEWHPEYLEKMYQLQNTFDDLDVLFCGWKVKRGQNITLNKYYRFYQSKGIHQIDLKYYLDIHAKKIDICNTNVVILKRELLLKIGGFPTVCSNCKKAGDGKTWLKAMFNGGKAGWTPFIGATYHKDSENMVTNKNYLLKENCLISYLRSLLSEKSNYRPPIKSYLVTRIFNYFFSLFRKGDLSFRDFKQIKITEYSGILFALLLMSCLPSTSQKKISNYLISGKV